MEKNEYATAHGWSIVQIHGEWWQATHEGTGNVEPIHRGGADLARCIEDAALLAAMRPSGIWYCRTHHGIRNEDEHRDYCPWWEHAEWCDAEHDELLDGGACSPCDFVELLVPGAEGDTDG